MNAGHDDFAFEPIPGLPEALPEGERLIWQGAPQWRLLARRLFHTRLLVLYFAALMLWQGGTALGEGATALEAVAGALWAATLGSLAIGLLVLLAWLTARSTVYSITSRRVVMRFGIAIPITVNLPFELIESAGVKCHRDGSGDIVLSLAAGQRVGYFTMWPHVRPGRFSQAQPMLRALPEATHVAGLLAGALRTAAGQSAPGLAGAASEGGQSGRGHQPAPLAGAAA